LAQSSRRKYLKYVLGGAAAVAAGAAIGHYLWFRPTPPKEEEKVIKIGYSSGLTGFMASFVDMERRMQELWTELVNADGGIYIKEYGRKLPVTWVLYNDMGDPERYIRNVKRMVEVDKVHVIFGSCGTFQSFAIDPVIKGWDILLCAGGAGAALIENPAEFERIYLQKDPYRDKEGRPWYEKGRQIWQEPHRYFHMEALLKVLKQVGVSDVVIWEVGTLYGIESRRNFLYLLEKYGEGIKVLSRREYPLGTMDFTSLVLEAEKLKPDAVLQFGYADDGMAAIKDMIEKDFNPKLYYQAFGCTWDAALKRFGENLEGIMYHACGSFPKPAVSRSDWGPGLRINDLYTERWNERMESANGCLTFAVCQVIGELIRRAGSLDRMAIFKEVLKTKDNPIQTVCGPMYWDLGVWPTTPGSVGQIQGVGKGPLGHDSEIVSAAFGDHAKFGLKWNESEWVSAKPLYPKPKWKR